MVESSYSEVNNSNIFMYTRMYDSAPQVNIQVICTIEGKRA